MKREVIIALDFPTIEETIAFLEPFQGRTLFVKIGMELYLQQGPTVIPQIQALGHRVFLDLKLHDIPNTVYSAARGLSKFHVDLLTVHAAGGKEMMRAAKQGLIDGGSPETKVIAITQLTSTSESQMHDEQLITVPLKESVLHYATVAQQSGLDGVVSSVWEAKDIAQTCGEEFLIVTPGIRLPYDAVGDQSRTATPCTAREEGSSMIVVGRPITKSPQPLQAYESFVQIFNKRRNR